MNCSKWLWCFVVALCLGAMAAPSLADISAPTELTIIQDGSNVKLRWNAVAGASTYNVYKDIVTPVDLSFPYATGIVATNYTDPIAGVGDVFFYAVTATIPTGCLTGTVTDTSGAPVEGAQISGHLQSDSTIGFCATTLANGTYTICDIVTGDYDVYVYLEYRPVGTYEATITDGGSTVLDHEWSPFTWTPVSGHLTTDTYWTNDNVYQMTTYVWVDSAAHLYVEKGTTIVGTDNPNPQTNDFASLVVQTGGQAFITGDKCLPIVFTSAKPLGQRRSGDFGGLSIMGHAHNNRTNGAGGFPVVANGEGNVGPAGRPDTLFDGESSGVYRYFRIEYGGFRFNDVNELNGIAFYCVGRGTVCEYYEGVNDKDDGVEFFGGTVEARHIVIHSSGDDGTDWTDGWNGLIQWVVVQARGQESDHCIEADNYENGFDFLPRSGPRIANYTAIHAKNAPINNPAATGGAFMLRRGTWADIHNSIITAGKAQAIDVDDSSTAWQGSSDVDGLYYHRVPNGKLKTDNFILWDNGGAATEGLDLSTGAGIGDGHFLVENAEWDAVNCRPTQAMCINTITILAPVGWSQDIANYRGCGFVGTNATTHITDPMLVNPLALTTGYDPRPSAGSPIVAHPEWAAPAPSLPPGIVHTDYIGAFSGPNDDWMDGWTAFPAYFEN